MNKKILQYPQFRNDVLVTLQELSDKEMQLKEWINIGKCHCSYWSSLLMYIFHSLYDDVELTSINNCIKEVGNIFYTEEEAIAVGKFTVWFNELTDEIGEQKPDSFYLSHPDWPRVWSWAAECYNIMKANNEKYDERTSWEIWMMNLTENQIMTIQQKMSQQEGMKKISEAECSRITAEFEIMKDKLIAEWEKKAGSNLHPGTKWPIYDKDSAPNKIGHPYNVRHVIPIIQGGLNEWWNIHPSRE